MSVWQIVDAAVEVKERCIYLTANFRCAECPFCDSDGLKCRISESVPREWVIPKEAAANE